MLKYYEYSIGGNEDSDGQYHTVSAAIAAAQEDFAQAREDDGPSYGTYHAEGVDVYEFDEDGNRTWAATATVEWEYDDYPDEHRLTMRDVL